MSPVFIVIMGVSGCGKTTIAKRLAEDIGGVFLEGDDFHPPENKAKMGSGIPLEDKDRWPWFDALIHEAKTNLDSGNNVVLACSALKKIYRDYLFQNFPVHRLVYLRGNFEQIKSRMDSREHEYMTSELLESQFRILEEPNGAANLLILSIDNSPDALLQSIRKWFVSL